ncbi:MAG: biopolymer transporter ExbD [Pseudomonadota bacterium]
MRIERPKIRRRQTEGVVPMINVVFLLMIFFLMSSTIDAPNELEIAAPESVSGEATEVDRALIVTADGMIAWGPHRGDAAITAITEGRSRAATSAPLVIRADRDVEAAVIAQLLNALGEAGVKQSALITGSDG